MKKQEFDALQQKGMELLNQGEVKELLQEVDLSKLEQSVVIAELEAQNKELRESNLENRLQLMEIEALFDSSPVAYCVLDSDKRIVRWNATFSHIIGTNIGLDNKLFQIIFRSSQADDTMLDWLMDEHQQRCVYHYKADTWYQLEKTEFHSHQTLVSIEDISHQKKLEMQAQIRADAMQRDLHIKADLLATMSHEVRTPLTSVIGFLELLTDDDLPDRSQKKVRRALQSSNRLLLVLNDLLDLSKINAGHAELKPVDMNLKRLVSDCIELNRGKRVSDKHLSLNAHFSEGLPKYIHADNGKLYQILNNLLSNAVKYTEKGSIDVYVTSIVEDNTPYVRVSVEDTGIGIKDIDPKILFAEYEQVQHNFMEPHSGTGLGLSIAKKLVDLMEGEISAESRSSGGSRFWFRIPYHPAVRPETSVVTTPGQKQAAVLNILVAEDNSSNQLIIRKMLERLGHKVTVVDDGQQAVKAYLKNQFDLIIMDSHMPVKSGEAATREIRALEKHHKHDTPIASWTADANPTNEEGARRSGMDHVLAKPVSTRQLINLINKVIQ